MRLLILTLLALSMASLSGCYYGHLASGQIRVLWHRQPLEEALSDPSYPEAVQDLLRLVEPVRSFAASLGLQVDGQYTSYVDWPGDRIVTTLARTRAGSLEPVPWRYPLLGELPYRGYFDQARAQTEAERLLATGEYDVCVSGVTAYSTLGWLDDPVTRPMLQRGAASLVETLFHELVHATAFVPGEADFNEGVAQFIGQQASLLFFEQRAFEQLALEQLAREPRVFEVPEQAARGDATGSLPSAEQLRASIADRRLVAESLLDFRDRVALLEGRPDRARERTRLEHEARSQLAALPLRVLDAERVAQSARLSDACLSLRRAYVRDLPRHERLLAALGGDLPAMIERLRRWADEGRPLEDFFDPAVASG